MDIGVFFLDILKSTPGSFGIVFSVELIIYFFIYKFGAWSNKIKNTDGTIKELKEDIKQTNTTINEIRGSIQYIKENVDSINNRLINYENNKFAKSQSPISLTEDGKKIAKELDVEAIIDSHWENIEKYLIERNISPESNPYDIQQECFNYVSTNFYKNISESEMKKIKSIAYNNGDNIDNYDIIFGVVIRDKYLKINKLYSNNTFTNHIY